MPTQCPAQLKSCDGNQAASKSSVPEPEEGEPSGCMRAHDCGTALPRAVPTPHSRGNCKGVCHWQSPRYPSSAPPLVVAKPEKAASADERSADHHWHDHATSVVSGRCQCSASVDTAISCGSRCQASGISCSMIAPPCQCAGCHWGPVPVPIAPLREMPTLVEPVAAVGSRARLSWQAFGAGRH